MEVIIKCSDDCRGGKNIYGEPIEELVRCRECKKNGTVTDKEGTCYYWCIVHGHATDEWRYCDYGERKEGE